MMRRVAWLSLMLVSCAPLEGGMRVFVTRGPTAKSVATIVTIKGGSRDLSTTCLAFGDKAELLVGVAQGELPSKVTVSARGYSDADCNQATSPAESAVQTDQAFERQPPRVTLRIAPEVPPVETDCGNGTDDDLDGRIDCLDPDCDAKSCTTGNLCVVNQTCRNQTCAGGEPATCTTPPGQCYVTSGSCQAGSGCTYPVRSGACDDGDPCTTGETCRSNGSCQGMPKQCSTPPPGQCWKSMGACVADGGCEYVIQPGNTCSDSDPCTVTDVCLADGSCQGTRPMCPARACAMPSATTCLADAGCEYVNFDAGTACGTGGTCNTSGGCLPPFPFVPSNVAINDIPAPSASGTVTFDCGTTIIDTSSTPSVVNACPGQPPLAWAAITQNGGISTLVLSFDDLVIAGGSTLQFIGTRPVIVVSMNDIDVLGNIVVEAGAQACASSGVGTSGNGINPSGGGAGGGFGSVGGAGHATLGAIPGGAVNLGSQLRGGCPGGLGALNSQRAAAGGGALQLVALGNINLVGFINAPGKGGRASGFGTAGNGGGSGGDLLLEASAVLASGGGLTCNGGGGGEAGTSNHGQDGLADTVVAAGGTDNFLGGAGGDGAAGAAAAQNGEGTWGGGGGGVGRVRINVTTGCNIGPQVKVSPAATSNRPDAGCP